MAIVGRSGEGKSTIADLLVRQLDPQSGAVRIDGVDLRSVRLADIRRHVLVVDGEPFVFHATIAENIRYAKPEASDVEVVAAAESAGLGALIARLPNGIHTTAGERGRALSAGERQRVAIARAFLADPTSSCSMKRPARSTQRRKLKSPPATRRSWNTGRQSSLRTG